MARPFWQRSRRGGVPGGRSIWAGCAVAGTKSDSCYAGRASHRNGVFAGVSRHGPGSRQKSAGSSPRYRHRRIRGVSGLGLRCHRAAGRADCGPLRAYRRLPSRWAGRGSRRGPGVAASATRASQHVLTLARTKAKAWRHWGVTASGCRQLECRHEGPVLAEAV